MHLQTRFFNREVTLNQLKYLAIVAMVIDHIAYAFVPDGTVLALGMHIIGRITGPTMFFAAVEGYHHTHDLHLYLRRLAGFALISWFPFLYFRYGGQISQISSLFRPNVIYTILLGVLAIHVRRSRLHPVWKTVLIFGLIILCEPADWGSTGILMILVLDYYYGNFKNQAFAYCLVVLLDMRALSMLLSPFFYLFYEGTFSIDWEVFLYNAESLGAFLPIALLSRYRGEHGRHSFCSKWFFYWFYPAHLLVLGFLQAVLQ